MGGNMKTKAGIGIAGIVLIAAGTLSAPLAANAALSQCNTGKACGWLNNNLDALLIERGSNTAYTSNTLGDANDRISSVANRGSKDMGWYTDINLQGSRLCNNSNSYYNSVGSFNDTFSSIIVYSNAVTC